MTRKRIFTGRRGFLLGLGAAVGTTAVIKATTAKQAQSPQPPSDEQREFAITGADPLRKRAAAKGIIYGSAARYHNLSSNQEFATRFAQECAILVPENDLKWLTLRPSPDKFNFKQSDWLANFANRHDMLFRGHTLVWHVSLPKWFEATVNSKNAEKFLVDHIKTVAGHYAGKMHSWDVVNEAIEVSQGRRDGLRKTPWLKFLGPDYIELAFRTAAQADPEAMRVYNDFSLENGTPENEAKRDKVLRLLERLKSKGTPIDALGMQAHLGINFKKNFNANKLRAFLKDVSSLGLKILITEMDVIEKTPVAAAARDRLVASVYEDFLAVVLDEPAVIAVITWGLSDRYTWLSAKQSQRGVEAASIRPLPLDDQLERKVVWNAIARAFDKAPVRRAER